MSGPYFIGIVAAIFACAAALAIRFVATLCDTIVPFEDGPKPGRPPTTALIAGVALVGGILASRDATIVSLALVAVLVVPLAACWYSDVRCGIVSDYFTLVPLAIVLGFSFVQGSLGPLVSAVVVCVPFGIAAYVSKGRGMGWGDVKIVVLAAAVLGLATSAIAIAAACLLAVIIAFVRRRRSEPIAFAPYLAGSIAFAVAFPIFS